MFPPTNGSPKSGRQEDKNDGVAAQEELADETILVQVSLLLVRRADDGLGPHLLDILEDHVHVAVEGLDAGKELAVVAGVDEDLGVVAYGDLKQRKGADAEFVLLDQRDFELAGLAR